MADFFFYVVQYVKIILKQLNSLVVHLPTNTDLFNLKYLLFAQEFFGDRA